VDIYLAKVKNLKEQEYRGFFFNEGLGRFIVTVKEKNQKEFEDNLSGHPFTNIGQTNKSGEMRVFEQEKVLINITRSECLEAYRIEAKEIDRC